ncbi:MAG: hypothetical protein K9J13_13800 [Saprospiraceae bacterium]|nr:hypothetical protein [Saprospiraceae bacterium]
MIGKAALKDITVEISTASEKVALSKPIEIIFSISNNYSKKQSICKYLTPFEVISGDIITVSNENGEKIGYNGVLRKRDKPSKKDYNEFASGETKSISFILTKSYPIKLKGTYSIQFIGSEYLNKLPDSNVLVIVVD